MSELSTERQGISRGGKAVIIIVAVLVILAFVSAFAWPRWAISRPEPVDDTPTAPSIAASPLPENPSALVSALPETVGRFARQNVIGTSGWASSGMIEEYTVTYSSGETNDDVTLLFAQWADTESARAQYDALADTLSGNVKAKGAIRVDGSETGDYVIVAASPKDGESEESVQSTALWVNSTVVFRATGVYKAVNDFYAAFPM